MEINSPELNSKISDGLKTIDFTEEGYYISVGDGDIGDKENIITHWYNQLKKEYNSSSKDNVWVLMVTGYDPYELSLTGRTLAHILSDILNINEASLDSLIPNKGRITIDEWNEILDKMYKKNKLYLGLNRVI